MSELICNFCNKTFSNLTNLNKHKKSTKFCLELQNKVNDINNYKCTDCGKDFFRKDVLNKHSLSCKEKDYNYYEIEFKKQNEEILNLKTENLLLKEKYKDYEKLKYIEEQYIKLEIDYKKLIKENNLNLEKLAMRAIDNTGSKTTNNNIVNKNQVIASLQPLTNDYMRDQTQHFGIDYIRYGAQSMALFAKDYTFKNRIAITDASRKKFVFKDEQGNLINDFNGIKITDKFIETNKDVIEQSCNEYLCVLDYKMDMYRAKQDYERLDQVEMEHFKTKKLLNTILNRDNPDNIKNLEKIKNEFINHLIKMFEVIENQES